MKYVPIRVYSVFSRGKGAVDADVFADFLNARKVPFLAISDPFSLVGWESFREAAVGRKMKPLLGMEVRVRPIGSLLLFPVSVKGYFSLIASLNQKSFSSMEDVLVVCIPQRAVGNGVLSLDSIRKQVPVENFYLGLEWNSGRWVVDMAKEKNIPLVWAQPWKWVVNPEKRMLPLLSCSRRFYAEYCK